MKSKHVRPGLSRCMVVAAIPIAVTLSLLAGCKPNILLSDVQKKVTTYSQTLPAPPANFEAYSADSSVVLQWAASDGARKYTVYWKAGNGVSLQDQEGKADTTEFRTTVSGLVNGNQYAFIVTASNDAGESAPSNTRLCVPNAVPAAPANMTVSPGDGKATITWDSVANATTYTLYYTAGTSVTTTSSGAQKLSGAKSPSIVTGLTNGTTYAFIITATNSSGEGAPTPVMTVMPGNQAPVFSTSLTPSPADGATAVPVIPSKPVLSWPGASDPEGSSVTYTLYLGAGSLPSAPISNAIDLSSLTYDTANLPSGSELAANTAYKWRIVAKDNVGNTASSPVWSFDTNIVPPSAPSSPSPSNNASAAVSVPATLSWTASTVNGASNGNYIERYEVTIDSDYSASEHATYTVTSGSSQTVSLQGGRLYTWSVVAYDHFGGVAAGPSWQFRTKLSAPEFSQIAVTTDSDIEVKPSAMPGATSYKVYIDGVLKATTAVSNQDYPPYTTVPNLTPGTLYDVSIKAFNAYEPLGSPAIVHSFWTNYPAPTVSYAFDHVDSYLTWVYYTGTITDASSYPAGTVWHYSLVETTPFYSVWYSDRQIGTSDTFSISESGIATTKKYPNYYGTLSVWGEVPVAGGGTVPTATSSQTIGW